MSISTLVPTKERKTSKPFYTIILYILISFGFVALAYFGLVFVKNISKSKIPAALELKVENGEAEVFLDGVSIGKSPIENYQLEAGSHEVMLQSGDGMSYKTNIDFVPGAAAVVIKELGSSSLFSSGASVWFAKKSADSSLSVISEPSGADVYIDGTLVGSTPYNSAKLSAGGYEIKVAMAGYEDRVLRAEVLETHTTNFNVILFPNAVPSEVGTIEGYDNIYDVTSNDPRVLSDISSWIKAINYWTTTRGVNIKDLGLTKEPLFTYFIDAEGIVYGTDGTTLSADQVAGLSSDQKGAYLHSKNVSETEASQLTEKAKSSVEKLGTGPVLTEAENKEIPGTENAGTVGTPQTGIGGQATILDTGLGWLRVRNAPGLSGEEIAKVNVGEAFEVLDIQGDWVKIRVDANVAGWVSATYVSID
ncbi:PEGA domain-containing protein [Candidatus Nomurabacteria bacterium]|uniref:PEGA domain-containing protein n=1 Tax=candidate division WWE3 bacterium TaxID=2053526 RepID=A0A955IVU5_UNCKA|nr:PEGA domain-containing protein [candidate division WWE3 bacterium]MCB9823524.1 PEGA domain-containing protein [Candidatus Nomurabacteria bacterium]MCB9827319.1 PEGA domain-containing protein [Candidatus Nomurabacteria bacterium]HXK52411.1 PEGA domain-containing protein [bacterium]